MTGVGQAALKPAVGRAQPQVAGGAVKVLGRVGVQRLVEKRQFGGGVGAEHRGGSERVARQPGRRGGLWALAHDVADDRRPGALLAAEYVVESPPTSV